MADHEQAVADLCAKFLTRIDPTLEPWGDILGRWHDLGKYSQAFQDYLKSANDDEATAENRTGRERIDHSTAGAQHANKTFGPFSRLIAYSIAGHHAGLPDAVSETSQHGSGLEQRLKKKIEDCSTAPSGLLQIAEPPIPKLPIDLRDSNRMAFQSSMVCRMMFSALCDADFLATEAFMSPDRKADRIGRTNQSIEALADCLSQYTTKLTRNSKPSDVNQRRAEILTAAKDAANQPPGFFSLTVPTGGGKTISSLAFALDHARQHGMPRVIYAIPFTSIIEQTADVFRRVFRSLGEDVVLENHSALEPKNESRAARLAAENWDAPLVVTTNVQFLESLFANRTSRCRKLHRIAGSVIILDEAQTIPVDLLKPSLAILRELVTLFGCTIVLCTATQPAIVHRDNFPIGINGVREIVPDPVGLYRQMKRVESHLIGKVNDQQLLQHLRDHESFLCIVNTRAHASRIYEMLAGSPESTFHLSTLMTGRHRNVVLRIIRKRLQNKQPCRVISTQLIEAGVDVDFPVVFRSLTGLDSIAQAAGRCNREGLLDHGKLFVFESADVRLMGYLKSVATTASEILPLYDDLLGLDAISHYFRQHYWDQASRWDQHEVMACFPGGREMLLQFRTAAERFQLIRDSGHSVFIPFGSMARKIEKEIRSRLFRDNGGYRREVLRKASRHMVSIFPNVYTALLGNDIELVHEQVPILLNTSLYDSRTGLRTDRTGQHEPETLIL